MSMCVYVYLCLFLLALYFLFFVFISFNLLLVPSCVFLLSQVLFAFGPSLLSYLFWGFPSSPPSFLPPYSSFLFILPPRSVFVSCVCLPISSFHAPLFSLLLLFLSSFWLPLLPSSPLPSSVPLLPSSVLSCFSFPLLCSFCLIFSSFSYPSVFSLSLLLLFLLLIDPSLFPPLSPVSSFLSVVNLSTLPSPSFSFILSVSLLFSPLGFLYLSVISCSFFRFACFSVIEPYGLVFLFLYLCCFYILPVCHSVFLSFSFSLPVSPSTSLPLQFVFNRRVYYRFVCRLLVVRFLWSLPAPPPPPPLPPLVAFEIFVFLSSPPVSLRFISSFSFSFLASCCCLGSLSLSLSLLLVSFLPPW